MLLGWHDMFIYIHFVSRCMHKAITGLALLVLSSCQADPTISVSEQGKRVIRDVVGENRVEHMLCLYGETDPYRVDSVSQAYEAEHDQTGVQGSCVESKDYLGFAHNHPSKTCSFSDTDKAGFYLDSDARLNGVVCDTDPLRVVWKTKPEDWYGTGRDTSQITTMLDSY